ncbi:MAG: hypothetical protein ACPG61_17330 [Paracoccaceae bacterium]
MHAMMNGLSILRNSTAVFAPEGEGNPGGTPTPAPATPDHVPTPAGSSDPKPPTLPSDIPEGGTPDPKPDATPDPWGEVDDDLKTFIGEKTPAEIAKELKGAQSLLGKKQVGIPDDKSTPEEWAKFHETRGVPKEADGYDFTSVRDDLLKDIPEADREGAWDTAEEKRFREIAKAANLSSTEASELLKRELGHRMEAQAESVKADKAASKAATDLITENWGNKSDEYTQDANNFARHMGLGDDVIGAMQKMAGTNAEARFKLVDFMRTQGAQLREGGQPGKTSGGAIPASGMTPDQARAAKADYLAQGENQKAYMDSNHPSHKAVTDQVTQYLKAERGIK